MFHDEPVGRPCAVRDPHAAPLPHQRVQGHGDAAGCGLDDDASGFVLAVQVRLAVRHDHERADGTRVELAGLRQAAAEEDRSNELVDRDRRHEQQLRLVAPPGELGRDDRAISFTKGCYLGQETVARIDALGHVNRYLVGVKLHTAALPAPGSPLSLGEPGASATGGSASSGR